MRFGCVAACLALLASPATPSPVGGEGATQRQASGESFGAPIDVAVSVGPLAEIAERIGGSRVRVVVLTPPATPPESWTPTPREARTLSRADLYVSVGHPLLTAERPHLEAIAREVEGLERLSMAQVVGRGESTGDPHLWMDLDVLASTARRIAAWLSVRGPEAAGSFEDGLASYGADLARLDRELARRLAPPRRRPVVLQHPAWQRLLDRYGVEWVAIESEGKEASPVALSRLIARARRLGIDRVFTQLGVSDRGARLLADEIGAELVMLDPTSSDWLATVERAGGLFADAVR